MSAPSSTPLLDRIERIRERRDTPRPLYHAQPTTLSPFVRMAREARLRPASLTFTPDGCGPTGRAA